MLSDSMRNVPIALSPRGPREVAHVVDILALLPNGLRTAFLFLLRSIVALEIEIVHLDRLVVLVADALEPSHFRRLLRLADVGTADGGVLCDEVLSQRS